MRYGEPPLRIEPFGGREGAAYGTGEGRVDGERLAGTVRWSNWPRRRNDGVWIPNITGVIDTDDGAGVLFSFAGGYSVVEETRGCRHQGIVCPATFLTEDEGYGWLNCLFAVVEGIIDMETGEILWQAYQCLPEVPGGR